MEIARQSKGITVDVDDEKLEQLASIQLNGRQVCMRRPDQATMNTY